MVTTVLLTKKLPQFNQHKIQLDKSQESLIATLEMRQETHVQIWKRVLQLAFQPPNVIHNFEINFINTVHRFQTLWQVFRVFWDIAIYRLKIYSYSQTNKITFLEQKSAYNLEVINHFLGAPQIYDKRNINILKSFVWVH